MKDGKLREFLGIQQDNTLPITINGKSPGVLRDLLNRIESLEKYLGIEYMQMPSSDGYPKHRKPGKIKPPQGGTGERKAKIRRCE